MAPTPSLPTTDSPPKLRMRIITHNVRNNNIPTEPRADCEPPWDYTRRSLLAKELNFFTSSNPASIIFCQEALSDQYNDISSALGPDWAGYGVGRDDGNDAGERVLIFYRKDFWALKDSETRWLNPDNKVGDRGWGSGSVRIVTCVVLSSETRELFHNGVTTTLNTVLLLNTHLDNGTSAQNEETRREETERVLAILAELKDKHNPNFWVVGGDFNSTADGSAYQTFSSQDSTIVDAQNLVPDDKKWGEEVYTYTGFDGNGDGVYPRMKIDFVFVPANKEVESYAVVPNEFEDLPFTCVKSGKIVPTRVSDHRAVVVDVLV